MESMELTEGRLARSWRLARVAWALMRRDRAVLTVALLSAVTVTAATTVLIALAGYFHDPSGSRGRLLLVGLIAAWPLTFISVFFNVALAAAADAAMAGRQLSVRAALKVAVSRLEQIVLWSLLAASVGVLLGQIAQRVPGGGRVASWVAGAAWGLLTMFTVPVIAIEGCTAARSLGRSRQLIRDRWGEGTAGTVAITACFVVLAVPAGVALGVGSALLESAPAAGVALFASGLVALGLVSQMSSAVRGTFAVALYRYAIDDGARGGFSPADLDDPFRRRTGAA